MLPGTGLKRVGILICASRELDKEVMALPDRQKC